MEVNELKYWIAFNRIPQIGRARFNLLEQHFGSLENAWQGGLSDFTAAGLDTRSVNQIVSRRPRIDPDAEIERLEELDVSVVTWHDTEYPPRLKEIYDRPPVLYVRGDILPEDERSIAVVGTRKPDAYGREVGYQLTFDIASAGVVIVSGLARGIDGIAHRAALEAGQRTIAVLGCGVDVAYPREHAKLTSEIIRQGAVVSEFPLGVRPDAQNFPRRNRILSGMTLGTVVIQAPQSSGALLTAHMALGQDREVFAVPGNIFSPRSHGTNRLIRDSSAKLVTTANDVLEELNLPVVDQQIEMTAFFAEDENESEVLKYVTFDPVHVDEVIRNSGYDVSTVSSALTMMELKGLIKQVGGMNYIRLRETPAEYQTV